MKFLLLLLLAITVTSSKCEDIKSELNRIKSKIQEEQNEISEMLLNTMKDVTEASSLNVNNDPIVTPAVQELNTYLETMKSSVDQNSLVDDLKSSTEVPSNDSTNSTNCVDPIVLQSVQNVGEAQQLVSNILNNVSSTLATVSTNFNALANFNSSGNTSPVVTGVFSTVSSILQSVLNFTNNQIMLVNNRIETDVNTFSQLALNMSSCKPSNTTSNSTIESTPIPTTSTENSIETSTDTSLSSESTTVTDQVTN